MALEVGQRLSSVVCGVQVVVINPGSGDVHLACGGQPMKIADQTEALSPSATPAPDSPKLGKRYYDETSDIEVLCVLEGVGPLTVDGRVLSIRAAAPLPSSD